MLLHKLDQIQELYSSFPHLEDAIQCLKEHEQDPAPAKINFPGGYMMLQEGTTKAIDEGDFEAHLRYLDVQILLEGLETVVWADIRDLRESIPYDSQKDKVMYAGSGSSMTLLPGTCYFCWPADGHKACRHQGTPGHFRKAVIKLEL